MKTLNKLTLSLLAGAATFSMMTIPVFASNLEVSTDPVGDTIIYDDEGNIPVYADGMVGPEAAYASLQTFTLNGEAYEVFTYSETYKEVFDKVKEVLGHSDFVVKNTWGSQVYSWYTVNKDGNVKIEVLDLEIKEPEETIEIFERTFTLNGKEYTVECLSGTYKEVFEAVKDVVGDEAIVVKNQWGTPVYSWYKVTDSGKCTVTIVGVEAD